MYPTGRCHTSRAKRPATKKRQAGWVAGVAYEKATLKSANFAALIGKVGDQGEPFLVGGAYQGTSPGTGRLYLQINDEANDFAFADNSGEMVVEVESQSPERILSQGNRVFGDPGFPWSGDLEVEATGKPTGQDLRWVSYVGDRATELIALSPARLTYMGGRGFDSVSLQDLKTQPFNETTVAVSRPTRRPPHNPQDPAWFTTFKNYAGDDPILSWGNDVIAVRTRHGHYSKLRVRPVGNVISESNGNTVLMGWRQCLAVQWVTYAGP